MSYTKHTESHRTAYPTPSRTEWLGRAAILAVAIAVGFLVPWQLDIIGLVVYGNWTPYATTHNGPWTKAFVSGLLGVVGAPVALALYRYGYRRLTVRGYSVVLPVLWFFLPMLLFAIGIALSVLTGGGESVDWSEVWPAMRWMWLGTGPPLLLMSGVYQAWDRRLSPSRRTLVAGTVALLLVVAGGPAAAAVTGVAPEDDEATEDSDGGLDYNKHIERRLTGYKPAQESALACPNDEVTVPPGPNTSFTLPTAYDPVATHYGTDRLWVSQAYLVNTSNGHREPAVHSWALQLRPENASAVDASQIIQLETYNLSFNETDGVETTNIYTLNGSVRIDDEVTRLHILADVVTQDGRVERYVIPLCPPASTPGGDG